MKFNDILEFENNCKELFEVRADSGLMLWPIIRYDVHQRSINVIHGFINPHTSPKRKSLFSLLKYLTGTVLNSIFLCPKKPVAIFGTGVLNVPEKGKYLNRLYYHLLSERSELVNLYESSHKKEYKNPRLIKSYYSDIINFKVKLYSKWSKVSLNDLNKISSIVELLKTSYPINLGDEFYSEIADKLFRLLKKERAIEKIYTSFVRRKEIRFIILEDACYGNENAILVQCFKKAGVVVAEMQHGLVADNHPAYNFPRNVTEKKNYYFEYLPDLFFSFGRYWSSHVKLPSRIIEIGYTYLNRKAEFSSDLDPSTVVVISDGTEPEKYIELCSYLFSNLPKNYRLVFKPHPAELSQVEVRYGSIITSKSAVIECEKTVYDMLKERPQIIGFGSTVMVEALAFGIIPFVQSSEYADELFSGLPFKYFSDFSELVPGIIKGHVTGNTDLEYYWARSQEKIYEVIDSYRPPKEKK